MNLSRCSVLGDFYKSVLVFLPRQTLIDMLESFTPLRIVIEPFIV